MAQPVRLHIQAKRSQDSIWSLDLHGGVMSAQECASFEAQPFFKDALKLRVWVWDDLGKKKAWFEDSRGDVLMHLEKLMQAAAS